MFGSEVVQGVKALAAKATKFVLNHWNLHIGRTKHSPI